MKIDTENILSVSDYLDLVNGKLEELSAKIIGEVGKVTIDAKGHAYFSMRDEKDNSVMSCIMWASKYRMFGIKLEEGMKIIAYGKPNMYKPSGRFSFVTETLEPAGEGELKKKYEELKAKLAKEGLFDESEKRPIPDYVQKIGIITSKQGAVLSDFLSNIGGHGFNIKMIDSRVEGAEAVADLLACINTFKKQDIEVLVIMRGGGSFESLQAFNNELLVREVAGFPVPVIAAIGHDKDVPLISLAADLGVSTPSIVTVALNDSWNKAELHLERFTKGIVSGFESVLTNQKFLINNAINIFTVGFSAVIRSIGQKLDSTEQLVQANNPERQLKRGYSISYVGDKVIRSIKEVKAGDNMNISVSDGIINSQVK